MKLAIAGLLVVHGLIVAMQSMGSFGFAQAVPNPPWLRWWPTGLGQSWLLSGFNLEKTPLQTLAGVLWLAAGACLVLAGLSAAGVLVPFAWWRGLALAGAGLSLVMLFAHLHPFFLIGVAASAVTAAALILNQWQVLARFGL